MSTTKERVRNASSDTELDSVDLKFEVIVIPVADADRAKERRSMSRPTPMESGLTSTYAPANDSGPSVT